MILGFTGTQLGMTRDQKIAVYLYLSEHVKELTELHAGDCVGADEEIMQMIRNKFIDIKIICHPPDNSFKRAYCYADETRKELPYLDRNHNIVNASTHMLATPKENIEQLRSGTWATIRYAIKQNKPLRIIFPKGDFKDV